MICTIHALIFIVVSSVNAKAADLYPDSPDIHNAQQPKAFFTTWVPNPEKRRNFILPPLASLLLPGFDQWWEGQHESAVFYSGVALLGANIGAHHRASRPNLKYEPTSRNDGVRWNVWGFQVYQMMGGLSAYQSFRTAVKTRQKDGEFSFLKNEEGVEDVLAAPLRFRYFARPTTFIPLGLLAAGMFLIHDENYSPNWGQFSTTDGFFAAGYSYNAGTHEEALFRGWIMPTAMQYTDSPFWSNTLQASVFAAAHLSSNPIPWQQFLFGWYLGYLSQQRDWTLAESVFVHTWWDIIIFTAVYLDANSRGEKAVAVPLLSATF